tara:strand:+ start:833 stop:1429 length:597 start_codon:yes stop_codon:yes gene_type:complete
MEPGFLYKIDNQKVISALKKYFYSDPDQIKENRAKQNYQKVVGTIKELWKHKWEREYPFMEENRELYNYLNEVTYPHDPEYQIVQSWMKYYPENSFSGLHAEKGEQSAKVRKEQYSNIILIDQDPDIEGGLIVIAGDSMSAENNPATGNKPGNIRERLLTRKLINPGDSIVWDEKAVHGVSKVERGHRLVFVCIKEIL